jgi:hypothetical protein
MISSKRTSWAFGGAVVRKGLINTYRLEWLDSALHVSP